jgi:hypothetical protein
LGGCFWPATSQAVVVNPARCGLGVFAPLWAASTTTHALPPRSAPPSPHRMCTAATSTHLVRARKWLCVVCAVTAPLTHPARPSQIALKKIKVRERSAVVPCARHPPLLGPTTHFSRTGTPPHPALRWGLVPCGALAAPTARPFPCHFECTLPSGNPHARPGVGQLECDHPPAHCSHCWPSTHCCTRSTTHRAAPPLHAPRVVCAFPPPLPLRHAVVGG